MVEARSEGKLSFIAAEDYQVTLFLLSPELTSLASTTTTNFSLSSSLHTARQLQVIARRSENILPGLLLSSLAIGTVLESLFALSSDSTDMPKHRRSYSWDVKGQVLISKKMGAAPPDRRSSNQDLLPSSTPITVQAKSDLRRPTDDEIVGLFERMHKRRPEFVFLAGDMRNTLETQLRWNVGRDRIMKLWERVTQHAAYTIGSLGETSSDEREPEQNEKPQSDIVTYIISRSDKKKAKTHLPGHTEQAVAETTVIEKIILTSPSTIEVIEFLRELEEDHPGVMENTHILLTLMKRRRCWQITEARLDNILIEMDQADVEDVFDMPMAVTCSSSYQRNSDYASAAQGASADAIESAKPAAKEVPEVLVAPALAPLLQAQALRNAIRNRVLSQRPEHACKITKMLLELDNAELMALLENDDALYVRIERLFNLYNHYAK